jgi:hypothetical protein
MYAVQNNKLVYYRAPYPGSPFKDNVVDPDTNKPIVVCTPSLENRTARDASPCPFLTWVLMILLILLTVY